MSNVSVLRDRMAWRERAFSGLSTTRVDNNTLAKLLDVVEEVAAYDCPPDPEAGWGFCMYCAADTESEPHTPDCAYRRARELCGMDQDGAS